MSIALAPFFYETPWFYGLVVLLLMLLGYAGYWQRTRSIRAHNAELAGLNSKLNEEVKERKHAEILLEAQNAELERYAYTVSHDLKSPLVTIKGFASLLREDMALGEAERVEVDLTHIETAAEQMAQQHESEVVAGSLEGRGGQTSQALHVVRS